MDTSPATSFPSSLKDESPILSSTVKRAVSLNDWWLVKAEQECLGLRLAVGGIEMKRQQANRVFLSSPIVKRHSTFILETADGVTVIIRGIINKQHTHQNGFPPEANEKFLLGFPYNWEVYANLYCGEGSETQSASAGNSFIAGLPIPSADCAGSAVIPMRRLLEYLISTRDPSDTSKFDKIHRNFAPQAQNPINFEKYRNNQKHDNSQATGDVPSMDHDNGDLLANTMKEKVDEGVNNTITTSGELETRMTLSSVGVNNTYDGGLAVLKDNLLGKHFETYKDASPGNDFLKDVKKLQEFNGRNSQFKKICVSKERPGVLARRIINRSECLNNNNESEQTPEDSFNIEKNEVCMMSKPAADTFAPEIRKVHAADIKCTEPERSLFSGEGLCSSVEKASEQVKGSNESSPLAKEKMSTTSVNWTNSDGRRSSRLKVKNLKEIQVIKGKVEMEQKVGSMLERKDVVSDVRNTVECISHGICMDVAEVALEEAVPMCAEIPKNDHSTCSQHGFLVDEHSSYHTPCDEKVSAFSSVKCGEAELGSDYDNSKIVQQSSSKVRGSIRRRKGRTSEHHHMLLRSRANNFGVVSTESLDCRRSRSGRLLVPVLASWRNEKPIYDLDGGITGIAFGFKKKLPPTAYADKRESKFKKYGR